MKPNTYETKVARLSIDSQGAVLVESKHDSSSLLILAGVLPCSSASISG